MSNGQRAGRRERDRAGRAIQGLEGQDGQDGRKPISRSSPPAFPAYPALKCNVTRNRVDLDARVAGQPGHLNGGAGGARLGEVGRVDLVHHREIIHVSEEDRRANDVVKRQAGRFEQRAEVVHGPACLDGGVALRELAGCRIDGNLTRNEEQVAGPEGGRVGTARARCVGARERLFHAAFVTFPERRQRVQTRIRLVPPPTVARTF